MVKDQTETEMNTRNTMRDVLEYLRQAVPVAFRNAYLYDIRSPAVPASAAASKASM